MLLVRNIVLAARRFQPGVVGEHWLISNKIVSAVYGNKVCTEMVSTHTSAHLEIVVIQSNVTFVIKPTAIDGDVLDAVRKFIEILPDPEYLAIGFNFSYKITDDGSNIRTASKKFRWADVPDIPGLVTESTVWGGLAFTPWLNGSTLRTMVTPEFPESNAKNEPTSLLAEFNVNFNADGKGPAAMVEKLAHYEQCSNGVCEIYSKLFCGKS